MKIRILAALILIAVFSTTITSRAAEIREPKPAISLSADLLELLRAEMRELATGVQGIALSLPTADWDSIQKTSSQISASYIMKQALTPKQAAELKEVLPEAFKHLDAQFHARAERLGAAAAAEDPELVAFHYSRLLESCATCHSAYAGHRFPGFVQAKAAGHQH